MVKQRAKASKGKKKVLVRKTRSAGPPSPLSSSPLSDDIDDTIDAIPPSSPSTHVRPSIHYGPRIRGPSIARGLGTRRAFGPRVSGPSTGQRRFPTPIMANGRIVTGAKANQRSSEGLCDPRPVDEQAPSNTKSKLEIPGYLLTKIKAFTKKARNSRRKGLCDSDENDEDVDDDLDKDYGPKLDEQRQNPNDNDDQVDLVINTPSATPIVRPIPSSNPAAAGDLPPLKEGLFFTGKVKKNDRMRAERRQKVGARKKRECPLCMRQEVQVVRHLKEVHAMTAAGAKHEVIGTKAKEAAATKTVKECPIAGCTSVVVRLDMHLQKRHKVSPEQSSRLTKMAKKYSDHTELELTQPLACS
ncbi:hypothetical protein KP79_PYT22709 [Mizuhopecten yessoensis]|uniref:Uncharacterized protein n=1 Tax=Mizuhopecten yessoensis TaxID=6573 RepID=A0A210PS25_MIZYE|nr:hypothetical protein KP79_PYT22709 [Mizuhopecten yessoensis]